MTSQELFVRTDRHSRMVEMTPALAEDFLTHCNTHNRTLVETHVERLAADMKAGRWQQTHQGIAFSPNRVLLDGQHRLWAVVYAGVTVPMQVFFNEPSEILAVVDTGNVRTNDQILTLAGGLGHVGRDELATLRALIAGLGCHYKRRSAGEERTLLVQHREAVGFAAEAFAGKRPFRGIATSVTKAVLARAWYSCDRARLRHFAGVLQTGVPVGEHDQPIIVLFQFLIGANDNLQSPPAVRERYAKIERALSAFLKGEPLHRLFAAAEELFPLPEEMPQPRK